MLRALYEAVGNGDCWTPFLDALSSACRDGIGTLALFDYARRQALGKASSIAQESYIASYNRYYGPLNPWFSRNRDRPVGRVTTADSLLPYADLRKTEFYNDWCRPQGIGAGVGVTIQRDGSRVMAVSVLMSRAAFERHTDAEGCLRRLSPHLLRAAQLNRQLAGLTARAASAEAALDRLATAMLVINAAGQVAHLDAAAEQVVAAGDGIAVVSKMLIAANPSESQALRHLISAALQAQHDIAASPGGVMRISRPSGRRPYEVLVAPVSGATLTLGVNGPMAAVFVRDPEAQPVAPLDWLRRLYALTGAEARLMQALLAGDTLDAAADRFGVGKETLRSQLKSVFLKTGTSSQLELLRLGLRGLPAFQR